MSDMKQKEEPSAVDRPVGSEGGRNPSALSTVQRWSVARKPEVVLRLLRGESVKILSRELAVPIFTDISQMTRRSGHPHTSVLAIRRLWQR